MCAAFGVDDNEAAVDEVGVVIRPLAASVRAAGDDGAGHAGGDCGVIAGAAIIINPTGNSTHTDQLLCGGSSTHMVFILCRGLEVRTCEGMRM